MSAHEASLADHDTIAAISTPPGRGGIGIVRLSGQEALSIAASLLRLNSPLEHAHSRFTHILDPSAPDRTMDEAIVTAFHAPHSYTGDTLVEIAAHGSPIVLETVLRAALTLGARLANPGEFTQRAFLSGRLDLTQAEAVHDLISAQTLDQARVAAQQLGGAISRRVAPAKESLLHLIALLEAGMDFASGELDDVEVVPPAEIAGFIEQVRPPLEALLAGFGRGQLLRNGVSLALVGRPNAGKSSLFNRLLERDRAIVTALPGTTRDTVEETLSLNGIPLRLIDTAGLRLNSEQIDEAEQQGVARSREALADAGLILLVHDATQPLSPEEQNLRNSIQSRPHLLVYNKADLLPREDADLNTPRQEARPQPDEAFSAEESVAVSALTGQGIETLRAALLRVLHAEGSLADTTALANLRQQQAVVQTLEALDAAAAANANHLPHELILMDLHTALRSLDSLTGVTTTDDILGRIFSTFCIGK